MMDESWCFNECMDSVFLGKTLCCLVGVVVVGGCYKIVNNILLSVNGCVERLNRSKRKGFKYLNKSEVFEVPLQGDISVVECRGIGYVKWYDAYCPGKNPPGSSVWNWEATDKKFIIRDSMKNKKPWFTMSLNQDRLIVTMNYVFGDLHFPMDTIKKIHLFDEAKVQIEGVFSHCTSEDLKNITTSDLELVMRDKSCFEFPSGGNCCTNLFRVKFNKVNAFLYDESYADFNKMVTKLTCQLEGKAIVNVSEINNISLVAKGYSCVNYYPVPIYETSFATHCLDDVSIHMMDSSTLKTQSHKSLCILGEKRIVIDRNAQWNKWVYE
jgi:hypothetical protein